VGQFEEGAMNATPKDLRMMHGTEPGTPCDAIGLTPGAKVVPTLCPP
jgi:hypothetical protein